jgi:hypothetical protein
VQPVFDKHCIRCHDYGKEGGQKLNLARDRTNTFNTSYNELWRKKYIKAIGAGPADIQQPFSWGSHASKLIKVIREGHEDIKLKKSEFERIVTWIDINATYYPRYDSAYPDNFTGRCPLDNKQLKRLSELTGVAFTRYGSHNNNIGPQVSFDRPELSPCLQKFKSTSDTGYAEALEIIRAGSRMLQERPRADMDGFQACPIDQKRQQIYTKRQQIESNNREAIHRGLKVYDSHSQ